MTRPFLGFGLGLRADHYSDVIEHQPAVDWFEIISENYMVPGGKPLAHLEAIRALYPMVMHGVSMSIGSTDPLNYAYLDQLKKLIERVEPMWVSDHLCWTVVDHTNSHDLLPLPYNEATISHLVERIDAVQNYLGREILLENLSSYVTYHDSLMSEWQFVNDIARRSGCYILLDINNIYVSANNHHFDAVDYLNGIDVDRVMQFHLAGHSYQDEMIIDTHDHDVCDPVWRLYESALQRFGAVSTMIERDDNIPPFAELRNELRIAEQIASDVLSAEQLQISRQPLPMSRPTRPVSGSLATELKDLQQHFMGYLLGHQSSIDQQIESTPLMSAHRRLTIYRSAYRLRLKEAISTDYEKLHQYLGDEQFEQLMDAYIDTYPSSASSLRYYSIYLPDWLSRQAPFCDHLQIVELSMIEKAFADSFDAITEAAVDLALFTEVPELAWPQMTFRFQTSLQLLQLSSNAFAIWKVLVEDKTPPPAKVMEQPQNWVLWRKQDLISHYRSVDPAEACSLTAAIDGQSFAMICEALLAYFNEDETPMKAVAFLQFWVQGEMLVEVVFAE